MKGYIDYDEWYPVYEFQSEGDADDWMARNGVAVEIPDELVQRHEQAREAFIRAQDELERAMKAAQRCLTA